MSTRLAQFLKDRSDVSKANRSKQDEVAVVVSSGSGEVVEQNEAACALLGEGLGLDCWQLVGVSARGERVACEPGCTRRLVESCGADTLSRKVMVGQKQYQLTCLAVEGRAVSVFAALEPSVGEDQRRLTTREIEVLELMARGLVVSAIAQRLGISERTVRTHIEHMRAKLSVSTQGALVAQGYERGYL